MGSSAFRLCKIQIHPLHIRKNDKGGDNDYQLNIIMNIKILQASYKFVQPLVFKIVFRSFSIV